MVIAEKEEIDNAADNNKNKNNGNSKDGCEKACKLRVSVRTHLAKVDRNLSENLELSLYKVNRSKKNSVSG